MGAISRNRAAAKTICELTSQFRQTNTKHHRRSRRVNGSYHLLAHIDHIWLRMRHARHHHVGTGSGEDSTNCGIMIASAIGPASSQQQQAHTQEDLNRPLIPPTIFLLYFCFSNPSCDLRPHHSHEIIGHRPRHDSLTKQSWCDQV